MFFYALYRLCIATTTCVLEATHSSIISAPSGLWQLLGRGGGGKVNVNGASQLIEGRYLAILKGSPAGQAMV